MRVLSVGKYAAIHAAMVAAVTWPDVQADVRPPADDFNDVVSPYLTGSTSARNARRIAAKTSRREK